MRNLLRGGLKVKACCWVKRVICRGGIVPYLPSGKEPCNV